ncbi:glycoside hydrolase family 43 protein [Marinoscillum pacificum]|uniref:glycoside hydrolase family 43 protein n=1 Tax=Marinoscillum pacificum TaxID=392723 RepID=UPI00215870EE|nr:glycoside hydrolase 43 family protein [Marinoscillum pacificum]
MHSKKHLILLLLLQLSMLSYSQTSGVWSPDNEDDTFTNPIIHADYSDPDICRAGDDFYMTSSSFNSVPGLPILHSTDLVNWKIINYAVPTFPGSYYDIPQHGNGVWAPCLRFHNGTFYIYWGDPDRGIYMVQTKDPAGDWSAPILVKKAYGNIDPSPLWDDDGRVYLVHAFAHSRAGIKSTLQVVELKPEGDEILDKGVIVFDGHENHETIEGPKFYKRNGYYYIFAPAGGVPTGWQLILRSKNIYGPYEEKIVLAQGNTEINGPHQGGMVELDNGESWFVHFQDKEAYGRIVHLEPVNWVNDWPIMGNDPDEDGTGEPVITFKKPSLPKTKPVNPADTDEFNEPKLGLQWQWSANPQPGWYDLTSNPGSLKLNTQPAPEMATNLWMQPNLLFQKFPALEFSNSVKVDVANLKVGEETGLLIFGRDYASLTIKALDNGYSVEQRVCKSADKNIPETLNEKVSTTKSVIYLKSDITDGGITQFKYSLDGKKYINIGQPFKAREGKWVGAKSGLYALKSKSTGISGFALIDWFRVKPVN